MNETRKWWCNLGAHKRITERALMSMLERGKIPEQTALVSPEGERFVVIERELVKEPSGEQK
jgi:hypothetical protein